MDEVGPAVDVAAELRKDNPAARAVDLQVYADALRTYHEAADNVRRNGAICSHPRTGAPMENPYLKVQAQQGAILWKMRAVKADRVLELLNRLAAGAKVSPDRAGDAPSARAGGAGRGKKSKGAA